VVNERRNCRCPANRIRIAVLNLGVLRVRLNTGCVALGQMDRAGGQCDRQRQHDAANHGDPRHPDTSGYMGMRAHPHWSVIRGGYPGIDVIIYLQLTINSSNMRAVEAPNARKAKAPFPVRKGAF